MNEFLQNTCPGLESAQLLTTTHSLRVVAAHTHTKKSLALTGKSYFLFYFVVVHVVKRGSHLYEENKPQITQTTAYIRRELTVKTVHFEQFPSYVHKPQ